MQTLMIPFTPRYFILTTCALLTVILFVVGLESLKALEIVILPLLLFGALTLLGVRDMLQKRHAVLRNYPISAHMRFLFEAIRPEMRQYFFESEKDGTPFSRDARALVYQRAKIDLDKRPFGTQYNVYQEGYEWVNHSVSPAPIATEKFRITVGGPECTKPYSASVFNISAMSFGSLSANAIRALNGGAKKGNFAHDTGEGGVSPYHQEIGGDLIWELGSGYFGCRTRDARFDPEKFSKLANQDQIKMVEIKISQGAKPGHGGVLPAAKVSKEIAMIRGIELGEDCISPPKHSAFSTPIEMMQFIETLRSLTHGKPIGFKLCIGHPWEFLSICKAMLETKIYPDFIVVDGKEGGTGAAPLEFMDHLGMPMREGVNFVHNALVGINVRDRIRIGTSGKIVTGFDIARAMALGADWCNSARGFMFSLGCIQSLSCHTDKCPTGVATQDPVRSRALYVPDKTERVYNFHHYTLHALAELTAASGFTHPNEMRPIHFSRRVANSEVMSFERLYPSLAPGALLEGTSDPRYKDPWAMARPDSFSGKV